MNPKKELLWSLCVKAQTTFTPKLYSEAQEPPLHLVGRVLPAA